MVRLKNIWQAKIWKSAIIPLRLRQKRSNETEEKNCDFKPPKLISYSQKGIYQKLWLQASNDSRITVIKNNGFEIDYYEFPHLQCSGYMDEIERCVWEIGESEKCNHLSEGCVKILMVELRGIEPLTSWMPFKRSPNWATAPQQTWKISIGSCSSRLLPLLRPLFFSSYCSSIRW